MLRGFLQATVKRAMCDRNNCLSNSGYRISMFFLRWGTDIPGIYRGGLLVSIRMEELIDFRIICICG